MYSLRGILAFFILLVAGCHPKMEHAHIALQPIGHFDKPLMAVISRKLDSTFHVKTTMLPRIELSEAAFVNIKTPRYRADILIEELRDTRPESIDVVVGLTTVDISTTKTDQYGNIKEPISKYKDWGIFGLAYTPGHSAVLSTYRLGSPDKLVMQKRVSKIAIHELGHSFGLSHCPTIGCVMQDAAESIKTIDIVNESLCANCRKKIEI